MNFNTKDLMVTVLPKANAELAKVCLLATHICRAPTWNCGNCSLLTLCGGCTRNITHCGNCSFQISCYGCSVAISNGCFGNSCGPGGSACDPTVFCFGSREPWVIEHIEDLVAIKAELQDTLRQLDVIQKEGLPSSIGSKAEAASIEQTLQDALEQVRAAKKTLK